MPGIIGLVTEMPRERAERQLLRMLESVRHEAFYETSMWIDEPSGLYVGWSVRKNSFSDAMPLRNERGDLVLVFSGEEFSEAGTARRLKERGHVLEEKGPSYLVHLAEDDPTFPACLNGRFHGLLSNQSGGTAVLFNDRYGMHRMYYHEAKEGVYFAAEAKSILAVRPELRTADPQGLGEFVSCGCVLENRSLFKGIHVLPPASAWIFRNGSIAHKNSYFQPREWEEQAPLDSESYYSQIRDIFSDNLPRYFDGQERIAMSLTGGLDTRMIMAWQRPAPGSLPCYTFGGTYRDCRDVRIARHVAAECGQSHDVIRVGQEFLSRFPQYAERTVYLTDGCMNVSHSPDLYVNERAREIAPVRMTGNYGDEVLRRIRVFKPTDPGDGLFHTDFLSQLKLATETYASLLRVHPLSFSVFRQAPWHHYGLFALEQTQISVRTPYLDNDLVRTVFRAPESAFANNDVRLRLIADGNSGLRQIRTDLGFGGTNGTVGRVSREFQQFTMKAEYAYDYGMPQWVARLDHVLSPFHLERLFLGRHKFYHFRVWYRDALSQYVREMLLDPRTLARPYLERNGLTTMVRDHVAGVRNYTTEIHKVLTLELLHRLFLD